MKVFVADAANVPCIWVVHNVIVNKTIGGDNVNRKNAPTIVKMVEHAPSIRSMTKFANVYPIILVNDVRFSVN